MARKTGVGITEMELDFPFRIGYSLPVTERSDHGHNV